jgi:surface glycoprotein (TIGR04207 family)
MVFLFSSIEPGPTVWVPVGRKVNGAKSLDEKPTAMNRQQIIAVLFAVLMVGSMVAWGATLI